MSDDTKVVAVPDAAAEALKAKVEQALEGLAEMRGTLNVVAAAAQQVTPPEEGMQLDPDQERMIAARLKKTTDPLIAEQIQTNAAMAKEVMALKNPDEWKEYGKEIEDTIKKNGIPAEFLAKPGAYEKLLGMIRGEHLSEIVEREKNKAVEAFKAANALSSPQGKGGPPITERKYEMTEKENTIAEKLGISQEDWIKSALSTHVDGNWIRGDIS